MKPTLDTANTLILGCYVAEGHCAITGTLLDCQYETVPDVLTVTGPAWSALVEALATAATIDPAHVLILSNDPGLVTALSPPFQAPAPATWKRVRLAKDEYGQVGIGGDPFHWQALQTLTMGWGGRFRAMQVNHLPKARELWQQQQ